MARKFETVLGSQIWAWETLKCEDYLIIDGLLKVRSSAPHDREVQDLDRRFLDQGRAISHKDLAALNRVLGRIGEPPIDLVDGPGDPYAAEKGYGKAHIRGRIRHAIDLMPDSRRRELIDRQRIEAQAPRAANDSAAPRLWRAGNAEGAGGAGLASVGGCAPGAASTEVSAQAAAAPVALPALVAPPPGSRIAQEDTPVKQFELTFKQVIEKVGRLVVQADTIQEAMADYGEHFAAIEWIEPTEPGTSRIVAIREV